MLSNLIKSWVERNGPFIEGLNLLEQIKHPRLTEFKIIGSKSLIRPSDKLALKNILSTYLDDHPVDTEVTQIPIFVKKQEPEAIQSLRERAIQNRKRYSMLHARLGAITDDQERYEIAKTIMEEVIPLEDDLFDKIRQWKETGEIPTIDEFDIVRDTVQKMQKRSSLQSRISRVKSLIKKTKDLAEVQQYKKELTEKTEELETINIELGL